MQDFSGRVVFITGGASGIGLGLARALGERGAQLVLADIEQQPLEEVASQMRAGGMSVVTELLDVSDHTAYRRVAARTLERFGTVHLLFNNAGVGTHSLAGQTPLADWRWVIDVNVLGVAYGVEAFLPAMQASGEPAYIINTASMAGQIGMPGMGPYCASKFAVVGYSETLRAELRDSNVGVAVLCPAWVRTRIAESLRNHPEGREALAPDDGLRAVQEIIEAEGISVEAVTERILDGIRDGVFYLFTHPELRPPLQERLQEIEAAYGLLENGAAN